jgi:hypothetical protein
VPHKQLKNCSLSIGIILIDIIQGYCRNKYTAVPEDELGLGGWKQQKMQVLILVLLFKQLQDRLLSNSTNVSTFCSRS